MTIAITKTPADRAANMVRRYGTRVSYHIVHEFISKGSTCSYYWHEVMWYILCGHYLMEV